MFVEDFSKMTRWVATFLLVGALIAPLELRTVAAGQQQQPPTNGLTNATKPTTANHKNSTAATSVTVPEKLHKVNSRLARSVEGNSMKTFGDMVDLETAMDSHRDLMTAAGEKKYMLVKKKPKHKKIKMEVYKPKMKYKKIKMKVPVKKMKKKKVKGYLVKKHHEHH